MKVVVKRSEWLRGEGASSSSLYRPNDGHRCCLGFVGLACGLTDSDMRNVDTPQNLGNSLIPKIMERTKLLEKSKYGKGIRDTQICAELMAINDETQKSEEYREARITELGKMVGIEFEFVD